MPLNIKNLAFPLAAAIACFIGARLSAAHPHASTAVNQYTVLVIGLDGVKAEHMLDFGEFPASIQLRNLDRDNNRVATPVEIDDYKRKYIKQFERQLEFFTAPKVKLSAESVGLDVSLWRSSRDTLAVRSAIQLRADRDSSFPGGEHFLRFTNASFPMNRGHEEIVVRFATVVANVTVEGDILPETGKPAQPIWDEKLQAWRLAGRAANIRYTLAGAAGRVVSPTDKPTSGSSALRVGAPATLAPIDIQSLVQFLPTVTEPGPPKRLTAAPDGTIELGPALAPTSPGTPGATPTAGSPKSE